MAKRHPTEQDQDRLAELEAQVEVLRAHIERLEADLQEHLRTCPGAAKVARDEAMREQAGPKAEGA